MKSDKIKRIGQNKYEFVIECGYDILGNRVRKRVKVTGTKEEAIKKYGEMTEKYYHIGKKIDLNDITFEQLTEIYINKYCYANLSAITLKKYKQRISVINSIIGKRKLMQITPLILDDMFNKLKIGKTGKVLSNNSQYEYYKITKAIFNKATNNWELIPKNPMDKVSVKPKKDKIVKNVYDLDQAKKLIQTLEQEHIKYRTLILLALNTQCRRSELVSIKWGSVDLERGIISIKQSLKVVDGKPYETKTKTDSSVRDIYISDSMIALLKEYKKWQDDYKKTLGKAWHNEDRVFTSKVGTYMHPDTCDKILQRIIRKNNLDPITFHGLRSTGASILINNGMDPKTVASRLGHSTCLLTLDVYNRSFESTKKECANKLENLLNDI